MSSEDERSQDDRPPSEPAFPLGGENVGRLWSLFFLVVLFVLVLIFIWRAVPVLLLLFAGALVAIALRFVSDRLSGWTRLPPLWSLTLAIALLLASGAVASYLVAPALSEQIGELASSLRESLRSLERRLMEKEAGRNVIDWIGGLGDGNTGMEIWTRAAEIFTVTFGVVAAFFLTLIVGVFLAYNPGLYVRGFLRLIPVQRRARAGEIVAQLGDTLRWWMAGQLISMLVLAVTTWLMLWLLGVPLAFILGLLTGLLTFIPYLGPLIALIPILLIAFVESPTLMVTVLILYLIIQNLESNVLMPIIFARTIHLPPVLTIVAQVLLGAIFGFVGIILATPLMAAGIDLIKTIYVEDVLGDSMEKPLDLPPK